MATSTLADTRQPGYNYNALGKLPSTRYQGSKAKVLDWIDECTKDLEFDSVLDAFGGTGCVGYRFKQNGKQVIYNDALKFNHYIGQALIENSRVTLSEREADLLCQKHPGRTYPTFIADTFKDIYFTDAENAWLDVVATNIAAMGDKYKKAIGYFALFQACISKRPYNLFHRKNLYLREAQVSRSFGNKKTWDTPFGQHFQKFVAEANNAVFANGQDNKALQRDVMDLDLHADLIYIDTPYISSKGVGVNYLDFYHFLEGLVAYADWPQLINHKSKHKKLTHGNSSWCNKATIQQEFADLFAKCQDVPIIVVSYRANGIPTIAELTQLLRQYKQNVSVNQMEYQYVLSKQASKEVLLLAQ